MWQPKSGASPTPGSRDLGLGKLISRAPGIFPHFDMAARYTLIVLLDRADSVPHYLVPEGLLSPDVVRVLNGMDGNCMNKLSWSDEFGRTVAPALESLVKAGRASYSTAPSIVIPPKHTVVKVYTLCCADDGDIDDVDDVCLAAFFESDITADFDDADSEFDCGSDTGYDGDSDCDSDCDYDYDCDEYYDDCNEYYDEQYDV
jgi:hypothetical protein